MVGGGMEERGCRERSKELEPQGLSEGREDQSQQESEHEAGVCAKLTIWNFIQKL